MFIKYKPNAQFTYSQEIDVMKKIKIKMPDLFTARKKMFSS